MTDRELEERIDRAVDRAFRAAMTGDRQFRELVYRERNPVAGGSVSRRSEGGSGELLNRLRNSGG